MASRRCGRPKRDLDLAAKAHRHARKAIEALVEIVGNRELHSPARISAAHSLLDHGYGSSPRAIDVSVTDDFSQQLSAFLKRLHQEETSELIEKKPNSGLIEAGVVEPEIIEEAG